MAKNGNTKVVMYLVGVIVTLVLFIGFPTLVTSVISNDKDSRSRDHELEEKIVQTNEYMHEAVLEQNTLNGKTNVVLERILVKLEQIERNGS